MKKLLGILGVFSLTTVGASQTMAMSKESEPRASITFDYNQSQRITGQENEEIAKFIKLESFSSFINNIRAFIYDNSFTTDDVELVSTLVSMPINDGEQGPWRAARTGSFNEILFDRPTETVEIIMSLTKFETQIYAEFSSGEKGFYIWNNSVPLDVKAIGQLLFDITIKINI